MYQLNLLGCAELRKSGEVIEFSTRKALAILIYIACQPDRRVSRDRLVAMFWEDADNTRARVSLRQAVSIIRKETAEFDGSGEPLLQTEGDILIVSKDLTTDVSALERAAAGADAHDWQLVENLYKGDFLDGFTVRGAPAFEDWANLERQRLRELALAKFSALMAAALSPGGGTEQGIRAAMRVLSLDPMQEQAHRALMLLYARQGRHASALKQYHALHEMLTRELGVQPEPESQKLYRTIAEGRRKAATSSGADPQASPLEEASVGADISAGPSLEADLGKVSFNRHAQEAAEPPRWRMRARLPMFLVALTFALGGGLWWARARMMDDVPPVVERVFPIMSLSDMGRPALSPDGNWVVFPSRSIVPGNADLYLKPLSDQAPIRLTSDPAMDMNPVWSPDGTSIAFVRQDVGTSEPCRILVMPVPNGRERLVGRCRHAAASRLAWAGSQHALIFTDQPLPDSAERLYVLQLADGKVTELTHDKDGSASDDEPVVSSAGRYVAYLRRTSWIGADVQILDLETGAVRALTRDGQRIWGLAWSPGDKGVFFSSPRGGDVGLWWVPVSGNYKEPQRISAGLLEFRRLATALQRPRLVFEAYQDKSYLVADTGNGKRVVPGLGDDNSAWFADSSSSGALVFVSGRSGSEQLWIAVPGEGPRQLTNMDNWSISEPRWSPDGRSVAFIAVKQGRADLFMVPAKGGALLQLTNDRFEDASPAWSADGKSLYFTSHRGAWQVRRVSPQAVASPSVDTGLHARAVRVAADGTFYYVKNGEAGIWKRGATNTPERKVVSDLRSADWMNWSVTRHGVYYVQRKADGLSGKIRRIRLAGGAGEDLADTGGLLFAASFTVGPDGKLILTRRDLTINLMGADLSVR